MTLPRLFPVLCLLLVPALAGCQELADVINAGSDEARQNEENRRRAAERRAQEAAEKREEAERAHRVTHAAAEPVRELKSGSPAALLLARVERRLACRQEACRKEVLDELRARRTELLPGISGLLNGQREAVTVEALRLAGLFRYVPAAPDVGRVAMLAGTSTRAEAVWALGEIGGGQAVRALERLARLDSPPWMQADLCRALGKVGGPAALPPVERLFRQGGPEVRAECARAAGRTGSPDAVPLLERAARDHHAPVSRAAREALEHLPGDEAKRALRGLTGT